FASSLMVDEFIMAPVLSQPSLPSPPFGNTAALGISDSELQIVKQRAQAGAGVLGLRFTCDNLCRKERFDTLTRELGKSGFEPIEINSCEGNPNKLDKKAHSVLTTELRLGEGHETEKALNRVLELFRKRLL
ncbi:MAG TPA: dienelactone hydrolase, partial [Blastocatellia bacterium]|nr:dienelactone hydrolase [Blastocatellia bacterium]